MQKNKVFETRVLDMTHEGSGLVRFENFPFFVENALTGELIRAKILKIGKNFGFAKLEEILEKSPNRIESANQDYLRTGIADLAHLSYEEQLKFKKQQVLTVLSKAGIEIQVEDPLACEVPTAYRNKAQIPVREVNGRLETGFFRKNSHQLLPIKDFYIQDPEIDRLVLELRDLLRKENVSAYDEKRNKGLVRNIVIRRAHATGEVMIVLVLSQAHEFDFKDLIAEHPEIKSIQLSIKKDQGNAIFGKTFQLVYGQDYISDVLLGKTFRISARSFYQVNSIQTEKLYKTAYEIAQLQPTDKIIDAYSGIGTIGLCVADKISELYGMEIVPEAVENAKENAALNDIENAHYETGSAEQVLPSWLSNGLKADVIFVDPPRKGLDESFIQVASEMSPRALIYISCNPATFARDAVRFEAAGYQLEFVQPVDLFPQTHHIELVTKFVKK